MVQSGHCETLHACLASVTVAEQEHLSPGQGAPLWSQAGEDVLLVQQLRRVCSDVPTTFPEVRLI